MTLRNRFPTLHSWGVILPVGLLTLLATAVAAACVRGNWTEMPRDPGPGEGVVRQVLRTADGGKEVRCAARMPFALEEVWEVIADLESFGDVCSCVHPDRIEHRPDGDCLVEAKANSILSGRIPFTAHMHAGRSLREYVWSWDDPGGNVLVNRGRWVLTPAGPRETIVALSLEVEVDGVPTFVLRNLSLNRLADILERLEHRLRDGGSGKKWTGDE
jgi:hypothetical protein